MALLDLTTTANPLPAEVEAYCVKCKGPRTMPAAQLVTSKTGKLAAKGKCPVCGTPMMKFVPGPSPLSAP
jgi:hypothetical protein